MLNNLHTGSGGRQSAAVVVEDEGDLLARFIQEFHRRGPRNRYFERVVHSGQVPASTENKFGRQRRYSNK